MTSELLTEDLRAALAALEAGELVVMPTETVYGLAADATNEAAIKKVFAAKGRPSDHPLIVHVANREQLLTWVSEIPPEAKPLMQAFWPGPLTLIFKKATAVSPLITGGQDTVAIRIPAHPLAQALLQNFGRGVVAPSANRFGRISPTQKHHAEAELGNKVAVYLDGGAATIGIESTIVDVSQTPFTILRLGMIDQAMLLDQLDMPLEFAHAKTTIRTPGQLASHYAPATPTELVTELKPEHFLDPHHAILAYQPKPLNCQAYWLEMPSRPEAYARNLYAALRTADQLQAKAIIILKPESHRAWLAILDRLQRAASLFEKNQVSS